MRSVISCDAGVSVSCFRLLLLCVSLEMLINVVMSSDVVVKISDSSHQKHKLIQVCGFMTAYVHKSVKLCKIIS